MSTVSKVPYTINVDEYICTELDRLRKMKETLDFSMLPAIIERIQHHASSMESALYLYEDIKYSIKRIDKEDDMTDEKFRKQVRGFVEKLGDDNVV